MNQMLSIHQQNYVYKKNQILQNGQKAFSIAQNKLFNVKNLLTQNFNVKKSSRECYLTKLIQHRNYLVHIEI